MASLVLEQVSDASSIGKRVSVCATIQDGSRFVLCSLVPGKLEQQPLDITFSEGEEISFSILGSDDSVCVDLTGNGLFLVGDDMDDEEIDSDDVDSLLNGMSSSPDFLR